MRTFLLLALCLAASVSQGQQQKIQQPQKWGAIPSEPESATRAFPPELRSELGKLRDAALADDYAYKQLEHLTDSIGPRPAGSPQADAAAHYVGDELAKLGLEVRLEPVPVPKFLRGNDSAELVGYPGQVEGTKQKIYVTALFGNSPTPETGITADVVVVNDFDELKALPREQVAGKIVLYNEIYDHHKAISGQPGAAYGEAVVYRASGAFAASQMGAVATLVRSAGDGAYRLPHTGWSSDAPIPAGAVSAEDAGLIARLTAQGKVRIHLTLTTHRGPDTTGYNVVADLKGSEHPEQVVIVSGHLDSWDLGTGAIDDAAGVAVSMETANLIQKLRLKPKRTIRVIAWMNEENGEAGSKQYAKDHEKEWANHFAAMETDGGAGHSLGINIKGKPEVKKMLAPVAAILQESGAGILNLVEHCGADIEPLEKAGVPSFSPIQDSRFYFSYHHTAADTLDKIVPKELAENSAVVAVVAYALANIEQPLPR